MSAKEPAPGLSACLTDREMEILRLLVAGHTVKTIAARLGRSETSINERLRSARRKTGVGSSRELARLLDRQKTCDENIDLSSQHSSVKDLAHTATTGGRGSKGMIVMLIAIPPAADGLLVAHASSDDQAGKAVAVYSAAREPVQLVGSWALVASALSGRGRP